MPRFQPIDSDAEHHRVLAELGHLDDLEDWPLFQQQEARYSKLEEDIDIQTWRAYVRLPGRPAP